MPVVTPTQEESDELDRELEEAFSMPFDPNWRDGLAPLPPLPTNPDDTVVVFLKNKSTRRPNDRRRP